MMERSCHCGVPELAVSSRFACPGSSGPSPIKADANCQALIQEGILLTNHFGVGAPSQPNYISPASGDTFGLNSDSCIQVNQNVSTIVDLLEDKDISWGDYDEGLPYSGYDGFSYSNSVEGPYQRKHNLLMRFNSIALDSDRRAKVKNLTLFYEDLENEQLPQWSFVTPNLIHDGHDTDITVSCNWTRSFIEPLLQNSYFNDNTLVYVTWQANGQDGTARNQVAGILLGSAVPNELKGTTDDAYHNHYSDLASVQANWGLRHLGRWDVGANVWSFVASQTGDEIREWNETIAGDSFQNCYWNQSYGGVFSSDKNTSHVYVAPNLELTRNGRTILPAIASVWGSASSKTKRGNKAKEGKKAKVCKPNYHRSKSTTGLPASTAMSASTGPSASTWASMTTGASMTFGASMPTGASMTTGVPSTITSTSVSTSSGTTSTGLPDYYQDII